MSKGLLLTVGTSFDSEIFSIQKLSPDFVAFVSTPTSSRFVDDIVAQCNLAAHAFRIFEVPDDPSELGNLVSEAHRAYRWLEQRCGHESVLYINSTAGRKWMSTGLTIFAGRTGAEVSYVDVQYRDGKPDPATMNLLPLGNADDYTAMFAADEARAIFNRQDFAGAARAFGSITSASPAAARELYRGLAAISAALQRWDQFEHYGSPEPASSLSAGVEECGLGARELGIDLGEFATRLNGLAENIGSVATTNGATLASVADLYHNGCRRLAVNRTDDAVGRFYRTLEACGQFLLAGNGINTSNVDWARVPDDAKRAFRESMTMADDAALPAELALVGGFRLARALSISGADAFFNSQGKFAFEKYLGARNLSILAHGWQPITELKAKAFGEAIRSALVALGAVLDGWDVPQLPRLWS